MRVERFAPSPTGPLHLGHAFSALTAFEAARSNGGRFLLRIEDIDQSRARPEWETQIYDDLHWLGLNWEDPVIRQSERHPLYRAALESLWQRGLLYPCTCNRRDIQAALSAPQEGAPLTGPDGLIYPGTCRGKPRTGEIPTEGQTALRLDIGKAIGALGTPEITFEETGTGPDGETGVIGTPLARLPETIGDIVLARRDMGTSYHLSVVIDDAEQQITHVTRGQDLFEATVIHILLQDLLGLPRPLYHHHHLIRDDAGKRLAKRDDARAIATYRAAGARPEEIKKMVGL